MRPDHLIELAGSILRIGSGYPRQATINWAISTAYYAVFHALAGECVALLVGSPRSSRYWEIVTPIHRSIDHGSARRLFERLTREHGTPSALKQVGTAFLELQTARHAADYDPGNRYSRGKALDFIVQAQSAIETLGAMPKEDRLLLAVQLITKPR